MQSIEKFNVINFDLVGACIARPTKSDENISGRPMVAPTKKQEALSNFNPSVAHATPPLESTKGRLDRNVNFKYVKVV